jgi:coenzyme F420-reducing hydrogenase beta subunit
MQSNAEGFLYPVINESLCNQCELCEKTCPMFRDDLQDNFLEVFAAKSLNKEQMFVSASGGIFPILAENVLEQKGVVFGCAFNENLVAQHIAIENPNELHRLQNSKYVQSDTLDTYIQVKGFLEQSRKVLYSGTPCQIAGLKAFCGKNENLITVDLICHGVPSPRLFVKYITQLGKKMGGKVLEYNFRCKEADGWKTGANKKTKTKTKTKTIDSARDPYYFRFKTSESLRESCFSCKFACGKRAGDFTIGDYWGIEEVHPEFYSNLGVSVVLINTDKGRKIWQNVQNKVECIQSSFENAARKLKNLKHPTKRPVTRDSFYNNDKRLLKIPFCVKLKILLAKRPTIRFLKGFIPKKTIQKIKDFL